MPRYCRSGCAASGSGTDASDEWRPGRRSTRSIEVTPSKQGLERDPRFLEVIDGALEAIDDGDDFDDRAVEPQHLLGSLHDRSAGGCHILKQHDPRAAVEQSVDPLI